MSESMTSEKRLNAVERQRRALELRYEGKTIADELGYAGPSSVVGDKDNPFRMEHSGEIGVENLPDITADEFKQLPEVEQLKRLREAIEFVGRNT